MGGDKKERGRGENFQKKRGLKQAEQWVEQKKI